MLCHTDTNRGKWEGRGDVPIINFSFLQQNSLFVTTYLGCTPKIWSYWVKMMHLHNMVIVTGLILVSLSCFYHVINISYYTSYVGTSISNINHNIHSLKLNSFFVRCAIRNVNIMWRIFSSHNAEGDCYLRIFCVPWSKVVLFNHNLWSCTTPFRNFRCHPAVICNCCMLLYRSLCDSVKAASTCGYEHDRSWPG